ncbi:acetyl esterase/lipase [Ereboglobus sp. PH5-5]|uniref:alpha/beta hydrolase n=1 Tax=Ereboglobus sp. PH5-5 TaxID=2940529 RepID=UPI00240726C4|nr:alpha/beta hydrolase [Ereboglobus sp. PH5-5]MDF9832481.1 acetyl esterase/lipase [Ereboglobus sp. PH5-5]
MKSKRAVPVIAAALIAGICAPAGLSAQKAGATPPDVTAYRDMPYVTGGGKRQTLDLYVPKNAGAKKPFPLIIWIHGGGWEKGSKTSCFPLRMDFAKRGYAIASINYRYTSSAPFPAQIEDCKAAVRWLRSRAGEYNLDPNRFAAWGSSAGGHLAALLGVTGHVRKFDVGENLQTSSRVQAVVDFYGPADFTAKEMWEPAYDTRVKLLGGSLAEKRDVAVAASPVTHAGTGAAPFLICHGTKDTRVPISQSERLNDALKSAGVPTVLRRVQDAGHGLRGFSNEELMNEIAAFLSTHLVAAGK